MSEHECQAAMPRIWRMILAMVEWDTDAADRVVAEIDCCTMCWKNMALQLVNIVADDRAMKAGGTEAAADAAHKELERALMF